MGGGLVARPLYVFKKVNEYGNIFLLLKTHQKIKRNFNMAISDLIGDFEFNFETKKDIPELFVRSLMLRAECDALKLFIINHLSELTNITEEELNRELKDVTEIAEKEIWTQFASQRGE